MNIYVNTIGVPRLPRNDRIYGGNSFINTNVNSSTVVDSRHFEIGTLTNLLSSSVVIYFSKEFTLSPTLLALKVYRMVEITSSKWVVQDVLHSHDSEEWFDTDGFSLTIDSSESLTGVIIEYGFA